MKRKKKKGTRRQMKASLNYSVAEMALQMMIADGGAEKGETAAGEAKIPSIMRRTWLPRQKPHRDIEYDQRYACKLISAVYGGDGSCVSERLL